MRVTEVLLPPVPPVLAEPVGPRALALDQ